MKNKFYNVLALVVFLFLLTPSGYCDTAVATETVNNNTELLVIMLKFGKVMFGVIIASFIIYAILSVWNIIIKKQKKQKVADTSLKTPQNVDEAILFFINKNKLK